MNLKTLGSYAWRTIKFILLGLCLILPQQVFSLPHILPQNFSPLATNILTWGLLLLGYALVIVIFNWQFKKISLILIRSSKNYLIRISMPLSQVLSLCLSLRSSTECS